MGICAEHFEDPHLREFINQNIREAHCDYCDKDKASASFDDLTMFVEESISTEYCEPYEEGAPYNSEAEYYEDRFPGIHVEWTQDLLQEFIDVDNFAIIEDLTSGFNNDYWTETEAIFGPTKGEAFIGGWESFKGILKHKIRFLFFDPSQKNLFESNEYINPYYVLHEAGKAITDLGLLTDIPVESLEIFRGRQHAINEIVNSAKSLGSPPSNISKANRMSPPGISMFYGASDIETCKREALDSEWHNSAFTTGIFVNCKPLKFVDFTKLPAMPSLFDVKNRGNRNKVGFLSAFVRDLSIPVMPDDRVHIEYIPTQVVTEFLKIKLGVDGIVYESVKNPGHKCTVVFADNDQMTDSDHVGVIHLLALRNGSTTTETHA